MAQFYPTYKSSLAEFFNTWALVFFGTQSIVMANSLNTSSAVNVGLLGIAATWAVTIMIMVYATGYVSGAHINPAVTINLAIFGGFPRRLVLPYILMQCLGAIAGAYTVYFIGTPYLSVQAGLTLNKIGGFATYVGGNPGNSVSYPVFNAFLNEVVLTAMLLFVIMAVTRAQSWAVVAVRDIKGSVIPRGFAPICIGFTVGIGIMAGGPITNTSLNPARSLGPALVNLIVYHDATAVNQLWLFILAPLTGGILGSLVYKLICCCSPDCSCFEEE